MSVFISPVITRAAELGVGFYEDTPPLELCPNSSLTEIEEVIRAVYRQVLGNAYVMASERVTIPESQLKSGEISVRDFVRQVAVSELYRSRFFDNYPRYYTIELNFKHLLGRAPESYEEISHHSHILDKEGFAAEINSYIDSDEYIDNFGENIVPYYRGYKTQIGKKIAGFPYLFKILRGASSSDKSLTFNNYAGLNQEILRNTTSRVIPPTNLTSEGGFTNVDKLLAKVLAPKSVTKAPSPAVVAPARPQFVGDLERKYEEQKAKIEQLQEKVTQLQSLANIGLNSLSKWQSSYNLPGSQFQQLEYIQLENNFNNQSLEQKVAKQAEQIKLLEAKIAQLQTLATIGESKLNKWRNRFYS